MGAKTVRAKVGQVWVLMWGGGAEPESPEITLHHTKAGALKEVRNQLDICCERDEIARVLRDLRKEGHAYEIEGTKDSFMELTLQTIND